MTTYTGTVSPGGTPDTRELSHLIITKVAVDEQMSNNCYVLRCRGTDDKVLTTHQHWDHHRALKDVVAATGALTVAGEPDADAITEQTEVPIDDRVIGGDSVEFGDITLQVIHIVGHTPGSVAFLYDDPDGTPHLWTGDSLFPGGVGNTFGDADAFVSLINDVETKIFGTLPDETWFYPGHGNDGRLGEERSKLAEWRERGW
jgi:glyoxylase-like metal-dependent hydrolase (beta-lactamase superfamily II)